MLPYSLFDVSREGLAPILAGPAQQWNDMSKRRLRTPSCASTSRRAMCCPSSNTSPGRWHGEKADYLMARRPASLGAGRCCVCELPTQVYLAKL